MTKLVHLCIGKSVSVDTDEKTPLRLQAYLRGVSVFLIIKQQILSLYASDITS